MEFIDGHVHVMEVGHLWGGEINATYDHVLQGLAVNNINKALLVPINDISYQAIDAMNDMLEVLVSRNKNLVGFIDIDISKCHYYQGIKNMEEDIIRRHNNGLKGIKVHLQNLGVNAADWRLLPIYRLAGELNIPVMIHCHPGSSPGNVENSHPKHIEKMVRVFHKTQFIICHFGGVLYHNYMEWLNFDNVYFDTSGILPRFKEVMGLEGISRLFKDLGYDKIFFASDYPTCSLEETIDIIKAVVPAEAQALVFGENIKKFGKAFGWW